MKRIKENLYMITLPMPFRLQHVHVFVLLHKTGVVLFDTGVNTPEALAKLEGSLNVLGRTVHDIDRIFITHFHTDHCGIAGRIQEISCASVVMSEADAHRIYCDQKGGLRADQVKQFYREHGLPDEYGESLVRLLDFFRRATIPFQVNEYAEYEKPYHSGETDWIVLPAPGHTRGQICFYFPEYRILLSGDHVLPHITPNLSPDPYEPSFRPLRSFLESLQNFSRLSVDTAYPSHGEPITDLRVRIGEIIEHHGERKGLILQSVKEVERTAFQVSQSIFGDTLSDFDRFLALNETYVHLIELELDGYVQKRWHNGNILYRAL